MNPNDNPINLVMVSYMRPNDLDRSLMSIFAHTDYPFRLTLIDNSSGAVDHVIDKYLKHSAFNVIYNPINMGKARSFASYLDTIMIGNTNRFFVSIDGDIEVSANWLSKLINAASTIQKPFGALAPFYIRRFDDSIDINEKWLVHQKLDFCHYTGNVYYNKRVGGGLLLIDYEFYALSGGYDARYLYGGDDGRMCNQANALDRFIGFTTDVRVRHLRMDETPEYKKWKHENINNKETALGHWDLNNGSNK
jgi:hypothetical protein